MKSRKDRVNELTDEEDVLGNGLSPYKADLLIVLFIITSKNLALFCLYPENIGEVNLKLCLAAETFRKRAFYSVAWLLFIRLTQVYS